MNEEDQFAVVNTRGLPISISKDHMIFFIGLTLLKHSLLIIT